MSFVHLHVHSDFSLIDGGVRVQDLVREAARLEMPAMALTDHGNICGVVEFYQAARAAGIRPIVGCELYVAGSDHRARQDPESNPTHHLTVLACRDEGYRSLCELVSRANVEGYHRRPRVDRELLASHARGLIALSGCPSSGFAQALLRDDLREAEARLLDLQDLFGKDGVYVEVMDHGLGIEKRLIGSQLELSRRTGIPAVATNDIHYLHEEDCEAHDALMCIHTGKTVAATDRLRFDSDQFFLKTYDEMAALFPGRTDVLDRTLEVAERCTLELPLGVHRLPVFHPEGGEDVRVLFRRLCEEGLRRRYGEVAKEARDRLESEMRTIESMGFVPYFLIVWDFIRYAREHGVPVGPGRGSAAGSIVAYALDITQLDPLRHDLLFERFLNSERISMPDIDIDFCKEGREEVIRYVQEKYGAANVAQIATFGKLAARAVIRDVGRVLDLPLKDVDQLARKVPETPGTRLKDVLDTDREIQELRDNRPEIRHLLELALRCEGLNRHTSTHAAGVVISDEPLENVVPLLRNGDDIMTGFSMESVEAIGLLKMDFLGLKTLTMIDRAVKILRDTDHIMVDLDAIPMDDEETYRLLGRGDTLGVFQLESRGMQELLHKLLPDRFDDIVALLALYRPGPLEGGMVDSFVRRKHGQERPPELHPIMAEVLRDTHGVIVYQEQVMLIAHRLGGFSMNEADNLRKAMGKKKPSLLRRFRSRFVEGAKANGLTRKEASSIFDLMEHFGGYGFNKSHSTAYALVTYRTAFLKAHHPVAFFAALMTTERGDTDKVSRLIHECRRRGIEILPPDVNESHHDFTVVEGRILFGLSAVKGVGEKAVDAILEARRSGGRFTSLHDFCERVDLRIVNKSVLEALIRAGALDSMSQGRARLLAGLDGALRLGQSLGADRRKGQGNLFGGFAASAAAASPDAGLPEVEELTEEERWTGEKATLGFYVTGHPLENIEPHIRHLPIRSMESLVEIPEGEEVLLAGMLASIRISMIKRGPRAGERMAFLRLEDRTGSVDAVLFADGYQRYRSLVLEDQIVFARGRMDRTRDRLSLRIEQLASPDEVFLRFLARLELHVAHTTDQYDRLKRVKELLLAHAGECPVHLRIDRESGQSRWMRAPRETWAAVTTTLLRDLETTLGPDSVRTVLAPMESRERTGFRRSRDRGQTGADAVPF